jgi:hypothetical protein
MQRSKRHIKMCSPDAETVFMWLFLLVRLWPVPGISLWGSCSVRLQSVDSRGINQNSDLWYRTSSHPCRGLIRTKRRKTEEGNHSSKIGRRTELKQKRTRFGVGGGSVLGGGSN